MERWLELAKQAVAAGLKDKPFRQRAASSLGLHANGNSLLPPIPHMAASRGSAQTQRVRAIEQQENGVGHALPAASPAHGTCLNNQLSGTALSLASSSTAAVGAASSTAADSRLEVAAANGRSTAALDAQTELPNAVSSTLTATPSSKRLSSDSQDARADAEADADIPSSSTALLDDGTRVEEEEQVEVRHLESPGRFAAAQLLLMQQRQQRLQERRLTALNEVGKTDHMLAAQLLQQSEHQQTSCFLASLQPVLSQKIDILCVSAAKRAQHGAMGAEAVASSPVVLFSPGGPYCDKSKWYLPAGNMQVGHQENKCNQQHLA